ncbi:MAG: hypothetical protein PWP55_462 [Clostridiales bacterium]|nr:hypothetical protein [Clostridiales bacterium]
MNKFKKIALITLSIMICLTTVAYAKPASPKTWPAKTSSDAAKEWSVKFNTALDPATVNANTVYVKDENGALHSVRLSLVENQTVIKIKPTKPYSPNRIYNIYITDDVAAITGKYLKQPVIIPFTISNTSTGKAIVSVENIYSNFITAITVTTSPDIYKVIANSKEMHYEGNNTYTLGMTGLKTGDTVTIKAYNTNGKLIETLKHIIR